MYSYEDEIRVVELYIKLGKRMRATVRQTRHDNQKGKALLMCKALVLMKCRMRPAVARSVFAVARVILFASALALGLVVPTAARAGPPAKKLQREYLRELEKPIVLRGDYFKAVMAAYADFAKQLSRYGAVATASRSRSKELTIWVSKIEDYDIRVSQKGEIITVMFIPTVRGNFLPVLGGGATYAVDDRSFMIRSRILPK